MRERQGDAASIPALPLDLEPIKARRWVNANPEMLAEYNAMIAEVERLRALVPSPQPETPTATLKRREREAKILSEIRVLLGDVNSIRTFDELPKMLRQRLALPVVQDEAPKAALQRYERDVVTHVGGHYGEEQWQTTEMVPCETGAWVKWRDVAALGASRPSPADRKEKP